MYIVKKLKQKLPPTSVVSLLAAITITPNG